MRTYIRLALGLLKIAFAMCVSAQSHAEDRFEILSACASGSAHVDQRECLRLKMTASLDLLGTAQKTLMEKLKAVDQDNEPKKRALSAAQADAQSFVTYSRKHCEAFVAQAYGGNSQQDLRYACHAELNEIRACQIQKMAAFSP